MVSLNRAAGQSGALFEISGTTANNATWLEDIYFTQAGLPMDITGLDWKMTFRADPNQDSADLTLSIDGGELSIEDDDNGYDRILRITVAPGGLSGYIGDYIVDLASEDSNGVVVLWGHGVVTFTRNPVVFE